MFWQFWHLVTRFTKRWPKISKPSRGCSLHESSCYTGNCWVQIVFPFKNTGSKGLSRICCSLARKLDRPKRHRLYMMVIQHDESSPSIHTYIYMYIIFILYLHHNINRYVRISYNMYIYIHICMCVRLCVRDFFNYYIVYIDTFLKTPLTETWHGCEY